MLEKLKKILGSSRGNEMDMHQLEVIHQWTLSDIDSFLISRKSHMNIPYSDTALEAILHRFYEVKRNNGEYEIESKVYDKFSRKYLIPDRTQKIIRIIQRIAKSGSLGYSGNEYIKKIIEKYVDEKGRKQYEPELMPYYKMALERLLMKAEVANGLDIQYGSNRS